MPAQIQIIKMILRGPTKFPFDLQNYRYVESEASLLQLFSNDLNQIGLTLSHNPFVILSSSELIPESQNVYLRVNCSKGDCPAKLIYMYDPLKDLFELTSFACNDHTHQIYKMKELLKLQKKKQILSKRAFRSKIEQYALGSFYQNEKMKKRYIKFGKCLYINTVEVKDLTVVYFTGENYMSDILIFGLAILEICSKEKFKEVVLEFKRQNPKEPETVVSMNEEILNEVKAYFNSVCIYCFDNILPANMKIRSGVKQLIKNAFSPNQWETQLRKILVLVRNTRESPYLKYIYENYEKISFYNLPCTFVCLGLCFDLGQLLTQHTRQYWHRYKVDLEEQQAMIEQANSRNALNTKPIPEIQDIASEQKDLFVKLIPKVIQVNLQEIQIREVLSKLKQAQEMHRTIGNPNEVNYDLYKDYSPEAVDFLIKQRNRTMYCEIFQLSKFKCVVKQPNEKDHFLERQPEHKSQMVCEDHVEKLEKDPLWTCTCQQIKKTGLPCYHILKLLINQQQKAGKLTDYIDDFWVLEKKQFQAGLYNSKQDPKLPKVKLQQN